MEDERAIDATPTDASTVAHPPLDLVSALSHIQDDDSAPHEAFRWAAEQLIAGRDFEELITELTTHGWHLDDADEIIEAARKSTRRERGIITREDVVRDLNAGYRQATGGLSVAFRSGLFGLYGFTTGVMAAIRSLKKLKRESKKNGSYGEDDSR